MNLREISNRINMPINLHEAFAKAEKIQNEEKIKEGNKKFRDHYGNAMVDSDLLKVKQRKEAFEVQATSSDRETKKLATVAEVILYQQIEEADWFGPNARTIKASEFDDLENGADFIVEFEDDQDSKEPSSSHHLVIDVTFASDVEKKMRGIKTGLHNHQINTIKYYNTAYGDVKSNPNPIRLDGVSRVIVALNMETVSDLMNLWLSDRAGVSKALAQHKVQFAILTQALIQLEKFRDYAEQEDVDRGSNANAEIIKKYQTIYDLLNEVFTRKIIELEERGGALPDLDCDTAYKTMKNYLEKELPKKGRF